MDFFDKQERARRKTGLLVAYFVLAVLGIIAVLQCVFAVLLGLPWTDPGLLQTVAGGVIVVVGLGSVVRMSQLSHGGRVVAAMLGGEPVSPHTTDPGERRLMNVVEEMSIASGVPIPEVYLLRDPGINAFAAGHGPGDTAIGVTSGAVERLSRDELQGVIAHEFSHILHGDMRLNLRLMGLLYGILCIALIGGVLLRITFYMPSEGGDRGDRKGGGGLVLVILAAGLALYLVGWIGVFFGNLIKAAVSRQREFLADASAVQYTRNPDGIAGALWKIGKFTSRLSSPRAEEASHMFFGNGLREPWLGLFATHPPIPERIAAIAPNFDPSRVASTPPPLPKAKPARAAAGMFAGRGGAELGLAAAILASIPDFAREAARQVGPACALVYALLLDEDEERRAAQLEGFAIPDALREQMNALFARRAALGDSSRLALVDLAIPALRTMSDGQYKEFRANVRHLVEHDRQIDLFEFVLQKVLLRHLDLYFTPSTGPAVRFHSLIPLLPDTGTLLTAICLVGHEDRDARERAFRAGVRELLVKPSTYPLQLGESADLASIDLALDRFAEASPEVKRTLLNACAQCAAHDGAIAPAEYELVRAFADAIDCPVPPAVHATDEGG